MENNCIQWKYILLLKQHFGYEKRKGRFFFFSPVTRLAKQQPAQEHQLA